MQRKVKNPAIHIISPEENAINIISKNMKIIEKLIQAIREKNDAAFKTHLNSLEKLSSNKVPSKLLIKTANIMTPSKFIYRGNNTLIAHACFSGKLEYVQTLLAAGAGPDAPNLEFSSPLFFAIHSQNDALIDILLNAGANVNLVEKTGLSIIRYIVAYKEITLSNKIKLLQKIFSSRSQLQLDIATTEYPLTALWTAASQGIIAICKLLLDKGANPNFQNREIQATLISLINEIEDTSVQLIIKMLLEYGLKIYFDDVDAFYIEKFIIESNNIILYKSILSNSKDALNKIILISNLLFRQEFTLHKIAKQCNILLENSLEISLTDLSILEKNILLFYIPLIKSPLAIELASELIMAGANPNFIMRVTKRIDTKHPDAKQEPTYLLHMDLAEFAVEGKQHRIKKSGDIVGCSILSFAVFKNNENYVAFLLENGAELNKNFDDSSLLQAAHHNNTSLVKHLLDHDTTLQDSAADKNSLCLPSKLQVFDEHTHANALCTAIIKNNHAMLLILLEAGSNPIIKLEQSPFDDPYQFKCLENYFKIYDLTLCPLVFAGYFHSESFYYIIQFYKNKILNENFYNNFFNDFNSNLNHLISTLFENINHPITTLLENINHPIRTLFINLRKIFDYSLLKNIKQSIDIYLELREGILSKYQFDILRVCAPSAFSIFVYSDTANNYHKALLKQLKLKRNEDVSEQPDALKTAESEDNLNILCPFFLLFDYLQSRPEDKDYFFYQIELLLLTLVFDNVNKETILLIIEKYKEENILANISQPIAQQVEKLLSNQALETSDNNAFDQIKEEYKTSSRYQLMSMGYCSDDINRLFDLHKENRKKQLLKKHACHRDSISMFSSTKEKNGQNINEWFNGALTDHMVQAIRKTHPVNFLWIPLSIFDESIIETFISCSPKIDKKHLRSLTNNELFKNVTRTIFANGEPYPCKLRFELKDPKSEQRLIIYQLEGSNLFIAIDYVEKGFHTQGDIRDFLNATKGDLILDESIRLAQENLPSATSSIKK